MPKTTIDTWKPDFLQQSPLFDAIQHVSLPFAGMCEWPTLEQFSNELRKKGIYSQGSQPMHAVAQAAKPEKFDDFYESRIYLKGELQTRLQNWHDFFNAMCWLQFPETKAALNALHYECSRTRKTGTNRTPLENAITLFDECGAIVVTDDAFMLDLIREHRWKELFFDHREKFGVHVQCYVFGHAMFEKAIMPYIGMTAQAFLIQQDRDFFQQGYLEQLAVVDSLVSASWMNRVIETPKGLQPFPLLGVPGWWSGGQDEQFYANEAYFRSRRLVGA